MGDVVKLHERVDDLNQIRRLRELLEKEFDSLILIGHNKNGTVITWTDQDLRDLLLAEKLFHIRLTEIMSSQPPEIDTEEEE